MCFVSIEFYFVMTQSYPFNIYSIFYFKKLYFVWFLIFTINLLCFLFNLVINFYIKKSGFIFYQSFKVFIFNFIFEFL